METFYCKYTVGYYNRLCVCCDDFKSLSIAISKINDIKNCIVDDDDDDDKPPGLRMESLFVRALHNCLCCIVFGMCEVSKNISLLGSRGEISTYVPHNIQLRQYSLSSFWGAPKFSPRNCVTLTDSNETTLLLMTSKYEY